MRLLALLVLSGCLAAGAACRGKAESRSAAQIDRDATRVPPPVAEIQDPILRDFRTNWRQLINSAPEIALPVRVVDRPPAAQWEPIITTQCVFSPDVGGQVPQVTISWNEPIRIVERPGQPAAAQRPGQTAPAAGAPQVRLDLAMFADAFARNQFSSTLSTDVTRRFSLPASSVLATDEEARMRAGPGLFPRLMAFNAETLQDRDTEASFTKYTIVLRDLNQSIPYSIRISRLSQGQWSDGMLVQFLTPVCPNSF
jgi:hypothetical protein